MPLYLYPSASSQGKLSKEHQPNLAPGLLDKLSAAYGFSPTPEEVLRYTYAVLYSPTYRRRYAEALRVNFPRVPCTADAGLFRQRAALGQELIALHLLRSPKLAPPVANTNSGQRISECKRVESCVAVAPPRRRACLSPPHIQGGL